MATSVTLKPNAIDISGSTSGTTTLQASAVAGTTTLTLPAATDTLVGKATTDTLTNKTLTGAAMNGTLGATTPSTASVTTLTTSSTVTHSGGTANGVAYLDGSKVLTTGSALVFDGTNLGVGVTPSAWTSSYKALQIGQGSFSQSSGFTILGNNWFDNGTGARYINSSQATHYIQVSGEHRWSTAASGTAGNTISFTQAMTLDASGNLGIGTSSPTQKLQVAGRIAVSGTNPSIQQTVQNAYLDLCGGTTVGTDPSIQIAGSTTTSDANIVFYNSNTHIFRNSAGSSERARINSSGQLLWGTTSTFGNYLANFYSADLTNTNNGIAVKNNTNNTGGYFFACINYLGNVIGSINQNASTTVQYSTSSDYRLKEDIQPMTGALEKVALLKPVIYKWKTDGSAGQGFIAHELAEVVPDAVSGEKDAVETYTDEDGNEQTRPRYQGIDTSFLVATLTAAIQEQQALITQLQADVAALKGA